MIQNNDGLIVQKANALKKDDVERTPKARRSFLVRVSCCFLEDKKGKREEHRIERFISKR